MKQREAELKAEVARMHAVAALVFAESLVLLGIRCLGGRQQNGG